ncbi:hypothetical protein ACQKGO_21470 [Corallococcus interemptor]|uniref:hypothetical protein n=1 Tax=Corallococcus interemptor TaxID=2316720 RepID=UPI003CFD584C
MHANPVVRVALEIDPTVNAIAADRANLRAALDAAYTRLPGARYALPMAWRCAIKASNDLVDAVPRYSSADHGSLFKALISVTRAILQHEADFQGPFFDSTLTYDDAVKTCFVGEYEFLRLLNMEASFREGFWRASYEREFDRFRISLAPSQRRSALTLIDHKAEYLSYSKEQQKVLSIKARRKSKPPIPFALGIPEVSFLRDALPRAWQKLSARMEIDVEDAIQFQSFVQLLMDIGHLWFDEETLFSAYTAASKRGGLAALSRERFARLLDFFAATPEQVEGWGICIPFVKFGAWYAYWPFAHHVLPPSLTLLTLAMRKYPDDWNNSLGSDMAQVAKVVRESLLSLPHLRFVTMKGKAGVGDIDLGIFDTRAQVLMLCEIKTVFDRFRTNYQRTNFSDQRVNYAKAGKQLSASMSAIASGAWQLSELFGEKLDEGPVTMFPVVLTWYDQYNPWLGSATVHAEGCNFRVFAHLFREANGDLAVLHEAIRQLSRVYCVSTLLPMDMKVEGQVLSVRREVQTDILPAAEFLSDAPLSPLVKRILGSLPHMPPDWRGQLEGAGQNADDYHTYAFDEP